jgi:hypothetical protein
MASDIPNSLIFINSKNRLNGTPWDFNINFNNELIKAPKGHYIQFEVEQVVVNRSWYSIQEGLNTFQLTSSAGGISTITIPVGYYNAADLRAQLQSIFPTWTFTYDKKLNKFTFATPADMSWSGISWRKFVFTNNSMSELFGFDQTETPTFTQASPSVVSTKPIKVNEDASVVVHTNIPRQKMSAVDNFNQTTIVESDVLCTIPIQSAPFDNVVYTKNNNAEFKYNVLSPVIHSMRIYLTNEQNTPIKINYDWLLTLSVKYVPIQANDKDSTLKDIKGLMQLFALHTLPSNAQDDNDDGNN